MKQFSPLWSLLPGAALIAGCGNPSKKEATDHTRQKPNVIYLIADDLGIGDLSCYGATKISTPNIDRLAGQGVQFTNAYATLPVLLPASVC
jgi:arylsulfatase A